MNFILLVAKGFCRVSVWLGFVVYELKTNPHISCALCQSTAGAIWLILCLFSYTHCSLTACWICGFCPVTYRSTEQLLPNKAWEPKLNLHYRVNRAPSVVRSEHVSTDALVVIRLNNWCSRHSLDYLFMLAWWLFFDFVADCFSFILSNVITAYLCTSSNSQANGTLHLMKTIPYGHWMYIVYLIGY